MSAGSERRLVDELLRDNPKLRSELGKICQDLGTTMAEFTRWALRHAVDEVSGVRNDLGRASDRRAERTGSSAL